LLGSANDSLSKFLSIRGFLKDVEGEARAHPILELSFLVNELQTARLRALRKRKKENSAVKSSAGEETLIDRRSVSREDTRTLSNINRSLRKEYKVRRAMLLQRMDVTIDSFMRAKRAQGKEKEILSTIAERRKRMTSSPVELTVDSIFKAGPELLEATLAPVTNDAKRGQSAASFKSLVTIGAVPDRGGRTDQIRPSARDMMAYAPRHQRRGGHGSAKKGHDKKDRSSSTKGRGGGSQGRKNKKGGGNRRHRREKNK